MCDSDVNVGLIEDWALTRRWFMGSVMAAGMASAASAADNVVETDVTIDTPDGTSDAVLLHPPGAGNWPAVLVWPDIFGLRPVFRAMGKRLAAEGFTVLVPNPFYRSASADAIGASIDTSDRESMGKMFGYRQAMSNAGIDSDAIAYLGFLDAQKVTATAKKAGVQGYCMGGPLSFRTAAAVPGRIGAVGSFHGGGLVAEGPESPHLLIPKSKAAYLVAVAKNDDARAPDDKAVLKTTFAEAKRMATVEVYGGDHGWCVPGSQAYHEAEAERAWTNLITLYKANLV